MRTKNASFIDLALEKMQENAMKRERREGILEGKREGILEGESKEKEKFARRLLQRNMPIEDIADLTVLTQEEITRIAGLM